MTKNNSLDRISSGISVTLTLNMVIPFFLLGLINIFPFYPLRLAPIAIGITQLLYVIPLIIWSIVKRRWEFMKGVIIAAVLTALLNGSCWLILSGISI